MDVGRLIFEDGTEFKGSVFSKGENTIAEVVFNTSLTGYQEIITDPSYSNQIVVLTYPLIGNYGINNLDNESRGIFLNGLIVKEYSEFYSHWQATSSLKDYLEKHNVLGVQNMDTRAITKKIRTTGALNAILTTSTDPVESLVKHIGTQSPIIGKNLAKKVSIDKTYKWEAPKDTKYKIAVIDCGVKYNILNCLKNLGCECTVFPYNVNSEEIESGNFDGIFLSNGPGDPSTTDELVTVIKSFLGKKPIFGICLGHQVMAKVFGGTTEKLKFGHHGGNHPVLNIENKRVEITAQNHGFSVKEDSLNTTEVEITHRNLFDNTIEGIRHKTHPAFSVQYHPESSPGPHDSHYLFEEFIQMIVSFQKEKNMPKRTDIKSILILGSGPIIIGQACEFDYSGTQACKALKEDGYKIILVNSNPATIMTDPSLADKTYIEPLKADVVTKIIEEERPDAVLPTLGGQTALNLAIELYKTGVLEKYNVEMIGANHETINRAEDRETFKQIIDEIGLEMPRSTTAYNMEEAKEIAKGLGFPCVVRPAYTLGGTGGGIAYNAEEFEKIVKSGLQNSLISEVLVEESILGWKEYELEVMRDKNDNTVIICTIENIDPLGVHTGDSITVAPSQTLTDVEYQKLRDASIAIIRAVGVETGGSNVQFALNPKDGRIVVIEMNPRVSRSSALASKATGFPIAKFAAKLAVGYTLDELKNDITKTTPASFEPVIDYCVIKFPRFTFEKFPKTEPNLGISMKSVGEAMAIGRTFKEAFSKRASLIGDKATRIWF